MRGGLLAGAILVLAGCQSGGTLAEPFSPYGMRIVPPPATGSIGTAGGYAQPPSVTVPPSFAPAGTAPPATPGPPTGLIAPPQASTYPGEGNWQSLARGATSGLDLAPPIAPRNPYAAASVDGAPPSWNGIAQASAELNWRSVPATVPNPMPTGAGLPPSVAANQPPSMIAPIPTAAGPMDGTVYIPPVRPSVVRSIEVAPLDPIAAGGIDKPCCDPLVDRGGVLTPVPYVEAANPPAPYQWQPRR